MCFLVSTGDNVISSFKHTKIQDRFKTFLNLYDTYMCVLHTHTQVLQKVSKNTNLRFPNWYFRNHRTSSFTLSCVCWATSVLYKFHMLYHKNFCNKNIFMNIKQTKMYIYFLLMDVFKVQFSVQISMFFFVFYITVRTYVYIHTQERL